MATLASVGSKFFEGKVVSKVEVETSSVKITFRSGDTLEIETVYDCAEESVYVSVYASVATRVRVEG